MTSGSLSRPAYSRAERISDAVVHVAGLAAVAAAVPVLIVLTARFRGDAASVAGISVYGATFALMILCSALYNMIGHPRWSAILKRLDHSAIYLKIAGTYTPFMVLSGHGVALTAGLWGAALTGLFLKMISPERFRWAALALYLSMGWAGIVVGGPLIEALAMPVVVLMLVGGILYTVGVAFFLWQRLPFHNTIWHVFVLAASLVFYAAVTVQVVTGEPPVAA
ncbi:PAQR family membrane homeostasis protein TrhA [Ostreiculturibacter nitratireducens]|uniref:PAQR family membrane homeostasis protein TrhA n=1 Tax=Ostreiculturibacter nitratireducens TaxID=3075226 RepID=UPI0031B5BEDB